MTVDAPGRVVPKAALGANLICMASMLTWATAFPAVEILLPHIPPLPLTAARALLAVAVLLPVWLIAEGMGVLGRVNWRRAALVGGLGFGTSPLLLVLAQQAADPVTVAVITTAMPVIGMAMECVLDRRRVTWFLIAALTLSLIGGTLAYVAAPGGLGGLDIGWGAGLAMLSCVFFIGGSRATVAGFGGLTPLGRTTVTLVGAALALCGAAAVSLAAGGAGPDWAGFGWREAGALAVYGIVSMAVSQVLWIIGVDRLGVGIAAMHINAAPFYVMLFLFALGAPFGVWQAAGAVVVGIAVLVALRGEPRGDTRDRGASRT